MGDMVCVQCTRCGTLHWVKSHNVSISDDDLYTKPMWCGLCRDERKHIWCGADETDIYINYDANLDRRYF
jgi:hypothetical protein